MKQRISYFLVSLLIAFSFSSQAQIPTTGWKILDDFNDGTFNGGTGNSAAEWTVRSETWQASSNVLRVAGTNGTYQITTPFTSASNAWDFTFVMDDEFRGQSLDYYILMTSSIFSNTNGYRVRYLLGNSENTITLQRITNGLPAGDNIVTYSFPITSSNQTIVVTRENNLWTLYVNGILRGTGTDATYSPQSSAFQGAQIFLPNSATTYRHGFDNIRYREIPIGAFASAVEFENCNYTGFLSTSNIRTERDKIAAANLNDTSLGIFVKNSGSLKIKGAEIKTFKSTTNPSNVCNPVFNYRVFRTGNTPPAKFDTFSISIDNNCINNAFPTGGPCIPGDQKWREKSKNIDLTTLDPGSYTLEVFYQIPGSTSTNNNCGDTVILNNNGSPFKAFFVIQNQSLQLTGTNPVKCTPSDGSLSITGLVADSNYIIRYKFNSIRQPLDTFKADASGKIEIKDLAAGNYSIDSIAVNGCNITSSLTSPSVTLSNPPTLSLNQSTTPNTVCNGTPGGGTTPCNYSGPKVVINEIMVMPGNVFGTGGGDNTSSTFQSLYTGQEWIELYNPSPCDAVDISCYILGDKSLDIVSGAISFPQGTIIPPLGFLVVGGSNAPNVNINVNNLRSSSNFVGTSNWRFNNESGSCALYDNNLQIVDAVYWGTNSNVINDRVNSVGNPFEFTLPYPSGSGCNYTSGVIIPAPKDNPTQFEFIGDVASSNVGTQTIGKSTYRSTDGGGTWIVGGVGAANNTPGACNSTCATPSTGGGTTGTCNGTASVTATGSGSFKYEWKNGNTAIGKDSASVGNLCAGTYKVIVTDKTTNCVDSTTVTVADDIPQINPAFTQVPSICNGGSFTLPTTSTNNITGTWTPTIDNTKTTTYTFTPTTGQCANTATMTVTVNQPVTPAFTQVLPICAGGTITLPTSSNNSINGSWTPAIDNTKTTTYTFTPTDGQCATTATMTVTVNEKKQPLITCGNNTTNSVEFKWDAVDGANSYDLSYEILNSSSSPINSTGNTETTFTVSGLTTGAEVKITVTPVGTGSCFEPASSTCKAQACTTPNVSTTPNTVCKGTGGGSCVPEGKGLVLNEVMVFPAGGDGTPPNGLIYRGSKEYIEIFNGSCDTIDVSGYFIAMKQTLSVVSTGGTFRIPNVPASKIPPKKHIVLGSAEPGVDIPVSDIDIFIRLATSCLYSGNFVLANIDGWCALYNAEGAPLDAIYWSSNENNINTKPNDFGGVLCLPTGSIPSSLPNAQDIKRDFPDLIKYVGNNFTASAPPVSRKTDGGGEWVRTLSSSISKTASTGNCNGGTCSTPSTPVQPTCNGTATVNITTGNATDYDFEWIDSSGNVVGGNTQTIDKLCAGRYTVKVTDKLTGCVGDTTVTVTDNIIQVTPEFNTNVFDTICQGAILTTVTLPGVSNNGITGTWNPGSLSSDVAGDISYTFTPAAGQCADPVTFTQRVNARETPTFDFNLTSTICSGDPTTPNNLPGISNNNIIGSWSPTPISNNQSDEYTFTPLGNACANTVKLKVTVIQRPSVTVRNDTTIYHNAVYPGDIFSGLPTGSVVTWKNSNPGIGLPDSGKGNIPAFTAINIGSEPVTATITVKATNNNCDGTQRTFRITVKPLNRDVFIPNMFTPNGDGKNDVLMAYGNYITKIEMRIFNQWGQLIKVINNPNTGWDGTHNGKPQPVGVYVFTLRANLADGTEINKKGSITLLR